MPRCPLDGAARTARRTRRLGWAVTGFVLALCATGCARKAPGPDECRRASLRLLGITEEDRRRNATARAAVDSLMVECLTTPFDRELTHCLEERSGRVCLRELRRRLKVPVEDDLGEL